jgi:hypothetical protein
LHVYQCRRGAHDKGLHDYVRPKLGWCRQAPRESGVEKRSLYSDRMVGKILTGGREVGQTGWNNAAVKVSSCEEVSQALRYRLQ